MPPTINQISTSSERRVPATDALMTRRSAVSHFITPTCMTITATRTIPQVSGEGTTEVPYEAFDEVRSIVENESDVRIVIHNHEIPGAFHGRDYVPVPHYLLELTGEEDELDAVVSRIDPIVDDIIKRHTRQFALPIES
jgi:hypothetical protein